MDEELGITLDTGRTGPQINHVTEDPDITSLKRKLKKLFHENHTVEGLEVKIQLKGDARLIQQKRRPIPIHLQQSVEKDINKLTKQGHMEKANNIDENCFVSPTVITVKKDKSLKIALDSRKLNEITIKRKAQMPSMEKLISRRTGRRNMDLKTRSGLFIRPTAIIQRSPKPVHICHNRWKLYRFLPFAEKILRISGYTDNLSREN